MTLRLKAVSFLISAFFFFVILLGSANYNLFMPMINNYEAGELHDEIKKLNNQFFHLVQELGNFCDFIEDAAVFNMVNNKIEKNSSVMKSIPKNFLEKVGRISLYDQNKKLVIELTKSNNQLIQAQDDKFFLESSNHNPFLSHETELNDASMLWGVEETNQGKMIVYSRPIHIEKFTGTIIISTSFNGFVEKYSKKSFQFTAEIINDRQSSLEEYNKILSLLKNSTRSELEIPGKNQFTVFSALYNVYGEPSVILKVKIDAEIKEKFKNILYESVKISFYCLFIIFVFLMIYLECYIIRPIKSLHSQIASFRNSHIISRNSYLERNDELGQLARNFVELFNDLGLFRRTLAQTTFDASIIAITENILNYLGKSFQGHLKQLETINKDLLDFPTEKIQSLERKLVSHSIPEEEKQKLMLKFIGSTLKLKIFPELISQKVQDIINVLKRVLLTTDREFFSDRPLLEIEEFDLKNIFECSYCGLPNHTKEKINLVFSMEFTKVKLLAIHKVTLTFVLNEAIENSAQAIHRSNKAQGTIRFRTSQIIDQDVKKLSIEIEDDGVGLAEEEVDKIFNQQNIKAISANLHLGPGLKWCKSALESLGGTLNFESKGVGEGAKLSIKIPLIHT